MARRWIWIAVAVTGAISAGAALGRPAQARLTDLSVYLGAVGGLAEGSSLYDFTRGAAPFTYPPFAALVFTPLTWAPVPVVQVTWTLASLATVVVLASLVIGSLPRNPEPAWRRLPAPTRRATATAALNGLGTGPAMTAVAALALTVSAPISSDIKYGQVSLFLVALVLADLLLLRRTGWNGVLIGIAAAVKLTPLIFVPLLWFCGRKRAAVTAAMTFAGCAMIGALALPGDSWRFWTDEISQVSRLGYITGVGNQSLNGALMRLEVPDHARSVLVLAIGGGIAAAGLVRGVRLARENHWLGAGVVVGAASVVLSPVSWTHHQVWLVLAALLPVAGPGWVRLGWPASVLGVMILPVTALEPLSESRLLLAIAVAALVPLHDGTRLATGTRLHSSTRLQQHAAL